MFFIAENLSRAGGTHVFYRSEEQVYEAQLEFNRH